jgi:transcriptional regulator
VFDDEERVLEVVTRLTQIHESAQAHPWQVSDAPADYITKLLRVIVGIEIPVQRWVGKWKVSQNRPAADQRGVVAGLVGQAGDAAAQMAALVQQRIKV